MCIPNNIAFREKALAWVRRKAEVGPVRGVRHGLLPDLAALALLLLDLGHESLYVILRGITSIPDLSVSQWQQLFLFVSMTSLRMCNETDNLL